MFFQIFVFFVIFPNHYAQLFLRILCEIRFIISEIEAAVFSGQNWLFPPVEILNIVKLSTGFLKMLGKSIRYCEFPFKYKSKTVYEISFRQHFPKFSKGYFVYCIFHYVKSNFIWQYQMFKKIYLDL